MTEFDDASYLVHQVRRMPNGYRELRSRFFIAADSHGNSQLGHDLAVYCNIEMILTNQSPNQQVAPTPSGADINMRLGSYPMQKAAPLTPGYCFVGRVSANGDKASKFRPDDLVGALTMYDSETQKINIAEKYLIAVPESIDMREALGVVLDWNTACGLVHRATDLVGKGQRVFVHCMSGAVGYAVTTLCLLQGATVYGTASERDHAALREIGANPFTYANKD